MQAATVSRQMPIHMGRRMAAPAMLSAMSLNGLVSNTDMTFQHRGFTSLNAKTPYTLCFLRHGQVRFGSLDVAIGIFIHGVCMTRFCQEILDFYWWLISHC